MSRGLACPAVAVALSSCAAADAGLIGWWTFDEGSGTARTPSRPAARRCVSPPPTSWGSTAWNRTPTTKGTGSTSPGSTA